MDIRPERNGDEDAIHALTQRAFSMVPYADGNEQDIIDKLREAGALFLSLVAEQDGVVVGQVTFSPVTVGETSENWFGLGPIAVNPDYQKQGIGAALVKDGLKRLQALSAHGCVVIGDPGFYSRFGFFADGSVTFGELEAQFVQKMVLNGPDVAGEVIYPPAFYPAT